SIWKRSASICGDTTCMIFITAVIKNGSGRSWGAISTKRRGKILRISWILLTVLSILKAERNEWRSDRYFINSNRSLPGRLPVRFFVRGSGPALSSGADHRKRDRARGTPAPETVRTGQTQA